MKKTDKFKKIKVFFITNDYWFVPLSLSILIIIILYWRVTLDQIAFLEGENSGKLLLNSLFISKNWLSFLNGELTFKEIAFATAPLFYLPAFIFYLFLGVSVDSAVLSNAVWLTILIFSIYNLLRKRIPAIWTIIITLLFLALPQFAVLVTDFNIKLPYLSTLACILYLISSLAQKPRNYKFILLFSIFLAEIFLSPYLVYVSILCLWIFLIITKRKNDNYDKKIRRPLLFLTALIVILSLTYSYFSSKMSLKNLSLLEINDDFSFIYWFIILLVFIPLVDIINSRIGKKYIVYTLLIVAVLFLAENYYFLLKSLTKQICDIEKVVLAVPYQNSAYLEGGESSELNNYLLGYYLEKSGRTWSGESGDLNRGDYAVINLDGSEKSSLFMLENIDQIEIVDSINCSNNSSVVVIKKRL